MNLLLRDEDLHDVDLTTVYIYTDSSHSRDRELWRGFLSCILGVLLQQSSDNIDQIITDSLVDSVEDLVVKGEFSEIKRHAIHNISTHIAKAIGVPPEFALASFYESPYGEEMPTRLYKFHYKPFKKQKILLQEENMIYKWLKNFDKISKDKNFLAYIETWRHQLD